MRVNRLKTTGPACRGIPILAAIAAGRNVMANEAESRESGSQGERQSGGGTGNPRTERRQPIGGGQISREEERRGQAGGEGHVSQQSDAETDGGEPSTQTSTAQDESGQL